MVLSVAKEIGEAVVVAQGKVEAVLEGTCSKWQQRLRDKGFPEVQHVLCNSLWKHYRRPGLQASARPGGKPSADRAYPHVLCLPSFPPTNSTD